MEEKKKINLTVVVLNCLCAIIWDINLIVNLIQGYSDTFLLVLHVFCAIAWSFCGIVWTIRYIKDKRNPKI